MANRRWIPLSLLFVALWIALRVDAQSMRPHSLKANGKTITLSLPAEYTINVALDGLRRVRFMAKAPDGRIFATDMFDRTDNSKGSVLILEGWDAAAGRFARASRYMDHLRNPNNVAFYTDAKGQSWIYVPLTDRLLRYRYKAGDMHPAGEPEVLARYPDYGLDYKYGGWHLTRTVAFGKVRGRDRMFVAVGSSCNACAEKEAVRATISVMDPDGKNSHVIVRNARNAVGLRWDEKASTLLATNMGDDQLGVKAPEDTFLAFTAEEIAAAEQGDKAMDAGWPSCYLDHSAVKTDPVFGVGKQSVCAQVIKPFTTFAAHSSPLGMEQAGDGDYMVALHGAGHPRIGTGFRVVRFNAADRTPRDFMTGFLMREKTGTRVIGRPCGILRVGENAFLMTDDFLGAVYYVRGVGGKE